MYKPRYKEKCKICKTEWVLVVPKEFTICTKCQMRQIFSEDIEDKKYKFLDIPKELYEKSKFLRSIRRSYIMYKDLTQKQIDAFKKTVKDIESGKPYVPPTKEDPKKESKTKETKSKKKKKKK